MNNIQVFNTNTRTWADISKSVTGSIPPPRAGLGFTLNFPNKIILFGGFGSSGLKLSMASIPRAPKCLKLSATSKSIQLIQSCMPLRTSPALTPTRPAAV
jgi:hypothetical protein